MTRPQGLIRLQKGDITQYQGSHDLVVGVYGTVNGVYSSMGGVSWLTCWGI